MGHLTGEMFKSLTKTSEIVHVPYRGGNQLITDTVGGQISMMIVPATDQVIELHKASKIKILAVTSPGRLFVAPENSHGDRVGRSWLGGVRFHRPVCPSRDTKAGDRTHRTSGADRDGPGDLSEKAA